MVASDDGVEVRFLDHVFTDAMRRCDDVAIVDDCSATVMAELSIAEYPKTDLWSEKEKGRLFWGIWGLEG